MVIVSYNFDCRNFISDVVVFCDSRSRSNLISKVIATIKLPKIQDMVFIDLYISDLFAVRSAHG